MYVEQAVIAFPLLIMLARLLPVRIEPDGEPHARGADEEALWESEAKLRLMTAQIPAHLWTTDTDLRVTSVSGTLLARIGYAPDQYIGRTLPELIKPDDQRTQPLIAAHLRALAGEPAGYDLEVADMLLEARVEPLRDTQGRIVGCLGLALDVTERSRAEAVLRESEERFRCLVQNSSDIITILDADGTIRYESPSLERVLGYKPEQLLGKNAFGFVHPDDLPHVMKAFAEVVATPETTLSVEFRFRHADGTWRFLESTGSNMLGTPAVAGIVVNSRDITERRELAIIEERARIAREMHDGLAQVLGYVNTKAQAAQELLRQGMPERAAAQLAQLADAARSAYADVREDILELRTSLGSNRSLLATLRDYLDAWQEQSGVRIQMIITPPGGYLPDLSPTAELQLVRIIQEALANVRKHARATTARVELAETVGWVEAVVEDDGIGFDPSHPGSAPFPRFGLAMMHERAEAAGGTLVIESARERGTRVRVRFPADITPVATGAA